MSRRPVVVLDVVGLTPRLLEHMPAVRAVADDGFAAELGTVLPAVTCSAQATLLTGTLPREHGIVGNGWYFRDLGDVLLWRQHDRLVQAERIWDTARRLDPEHRTANLFWWYAMGARADVTATPRPVYHADGRKDPDFYIRPPELHDQLESELGTFPLFNYWGPTAGIASSQWIAQAAQLVQRTRQPDLLLTYVPHLDYALQRHGPTGPEAIAAARELDAVLAGLIGEARDRGAAVVVLSEYGITDAARPVDINRALRREGLLEVHTQQGMEYLDPMASRAFAVADHQIAHVYVRDEQDVPRVAALLAELEGVAEVLDAEGKRRAGLDHERSGELVAVAAPDAWFTYYYWLDDDRAPDFAKLVEIHRKPGYDPAELFLDPADPLVKARAGLALARKKLGFRYTMDVVPLDPSPVRGSHGRLPDDPRDGPVLLCSDPSLTRDRMAATDVRDLLLRLNGFPR
ncbi:nucleotide pyrophosphatase/phosphodiesterase family protein [Blastococcus capsensis]|uniref:nucleotide pyrophosphatase/phosphodiesterase family protein n=1 Tax=Blastococcus capsensis TaxID=1564163 RepID=UPI002541C797|nr:nucleotide pyrophosphatase/phosphodiesterase family protein [Blastococcus capsensis]MDK3256799.1 alkaline phosphatase family protein [Blastococcus capsensis]